MNKPVREGFVLPENDQPSAAAPAPAAEQSEPIEKWPVKVKLIHKSVSGPKNEDLHELSFREPTGGDINRYGNPCRVNGEYEIIIDERKMTMMMSALSGIVMPDLERMDPRDWNSCAYRLRGFFLPEPAAW
jgi:hypothetical protein